MNKRKNYLWLCEFDDLITGTYYVKEIQMRILLQEIPKALGRIIQQKQIKSSAFSAEGELSGCLWQNVFTQRK